MSDDYKPMHHAALTTIAAEKSGWTVFEQRMARELIERRSAAEAKDAKLVRLSAARDRVQSMGPISLTPKEAADFNELIAAIRDLVS